MKRRIILSIISLMLFVWMVLGVSYAFFENGIINNGEFKQQIVFESETYRLTTQGNMSLTSEVTPLAMFGTDIDKVVSETSTTINLTLENYDEEYRVCTYDVVWNWNETSDEYMMSSDAAKEYTIEGSSQIEVQTDIGITGNYENWFEEIQLPNYNANNNVLYSDTVEGNGIIEKWLNIETKFYNLVEIDQGSHISKNYSGYVTVENIKCNKTQYPKLSTAPNTTLLGLVSNQGVDTSSVTEVYFVDLKSSWPGSEANVAYFTAQDAGVIKAWTVGNKLYVGQNGKVMPGPSLSSMLEYKRELNKVDLSAIDTSEVTSMARMFHRTGENSSTFTLNLGDNFDTSKVADMVGMFRYAGYSSLEFGLDLGSKFDTGRVKVMRRMFQGNGYSNKSFTLDLGEKFDTSNVIDMEEMFHSVGYASSIFTLNLGDKFDTSKVTDMSGMFNECGYSSTSFVLDLKDKFDTSNVTEMDYMFQKNGYKSPIYILGLGDKFDTLQVTNMDCMFQGAGNSSKVFTLDLGDKFDTSNVLSMSHMFRVAGFYSPIYTLKLGERFDTSKVTNMTGMFYSAGYNSSNFTLDLGELFNTSNVTDMSYMFANTGRGTNNFVLNLGDKFDTRNVTTMQAMFANVQSVVTLDLGDNFDTSKVTNMERMFGACRNLNSLDLGDKFDTSKVENMQNMFVETGEFNPNFMLNLGANFNTSSVTNMYQMFTETGRSNPNFELILGNKFDTSNVTDMTRMFRGTGGSNSNYVLDVSGFVVQSNCNLTEFVHSTASKIIFGEGWSNATLVSSMFYKDSSTPIEIVNAPANIQSYDFAADNRVPTFTTI